MGNSKPEYGTNTSYLTDFIRISLPAKLINPGEICNLYVKEGQSAAQIAVHFGVAKSVILARLHGMGIREGNSKRYTNPKNYRCPKPPFGYTIKGRELILNKGELRICRLVVSLIRDHSLSANAVAKEFSRRSIRNRAGQITWGHTTIRSIFKRWKDKL